MALGLSVADQWNVGDHVVRKIVVTPDSSYRNAGSGDHGEALTAADMGFDIELAYAHPITLLEATDGQTAFAGHYDQTDAELRFYKSNGTTNLIPVASGVDLSGYRITLLAAGKGTDLVSVDADANI